MILINEYVTKAINSTQMVTWPPKFQPGGWSVGGAPIKLIIIYAGDNIDIETPTYSQHC